MKVTLGTLKNKGEELVTFLEPRVGSKLALSGDAIEIDDATLRQGVRPRHVKTYIKRFLYMNGVRKNYRVFVSGKELTVQEIELGEEKEEGKKEVKEPEAAPAKQMEEEPEAEEKAEAVEEKAAAEPKPEQPKKASSRKPRAKKKAGKED